MEKGRILIVDDDLFVREMLNDILSNICGYNSDVAVDGLEGLQKVRDNPYDIVFTDLAMPNMNGIDFLKEAKKIKPLIPMVMITAYSTLDNAVNAMREGARDFITKPFSLKKVRSIAERVIGETRLLGNIVNDREQNASVERLNAVLFEKVQEIAVLQSVSSELDGLYTNNDIYERTVDMTTRLLMVKEASFGIIEGGYLRIKQATEISREKVRITGSIFEKVINTRSHYLAKFGEPNPYNGAPLTHTFLAIPLMMNDDVFGILTAAGKLNGTAFTDDDIYIALTFAKKIALRVENNALYDVFYNNLISTLKSLVLSIEARDSYTMHHSERVVSYSLQIAEVMGLSDDEKSVLSFGGYLHDIGKIGVRDTVLLKPGRLSPEEKSEINQHPLIGYNILKPIKFFPQERDLIFRHHEHFDGSGYPGRLAGKDIPLSARILSVADTYDAMTTCRPYRNALAHQYAIAEIEKLSDIQFDGEVVRAFLTTPAGRNNINNA